MNDILVTVLTGFSCFMPGLLIGYEAGRRREEKQWLASVERVRKSMQEVNDLRRKMEYQDFSNRIVDL